jgi:2',3'-cyclic-nucleotide 2'-phosphodiesterase (5'-nucleotidase family)
MHRRFSLLLVLAMLATTLPSFTIAAWAEEGDDAGLPVGPVEVSLLHDTHFHGKFGPSEGEEFEEGLANIGRYMALVEERKEALDHALFLGNGDDVAPSLLSGVFSPNGIHMIEALNVSPIDVNTLANHEFDFGPDNLEELLAASEFPWVTANVRDIESGEVFGADLGVEEFLLFELGGVTVGVTGLAPENMRTITSLGEDTEQIPAGEALDIVVPKMRDAGAEVIVVSSHLCGTDAIALADARDDVDVFAGDHCAQVLEEPYVSDNGTIVSLAGDEFAFLGELTLTVLEGEVVDHSFTLHDLANDFPSIAPHAAVQEVVDHYEAQLDEQLNVVIGERTVEWDTRTTVVRTGENAFGNFLTDEMRAFHGADIAVQNSGGIRANKLFPLGEDGTADITRRDIAEILPFANHLVKAEITGAAIVEALEHALRLYPDPNGGFLQVSGMQVVFDPEQPAGSRVVSVLIGDAPLVPTQSYTMATNDFTLGGGDGFSMFADRDKTTVLVDKNEGPLLSTFLINRIDARTTPVDTTDDEGRYVEFDATVSPPDEPAPGPQDKDACKDGGWRSFTDPTFRNQGQCVAQVAAGDRRAGSSTKARGSVR